MSARLDAGVRLKVGEQLTSENGRYHLLMQPDGNLVHFDDGGRTLWNTETSRLPQGLRPTFCELQIDGNLVLANDAGYMAYETGTPPARQSGDDFGKGEDPHWPQPQAECVIVVEDDGNLILRNPDGSVRWANNPIGVDPVGPNFAEEQQ